MVTEFAEIYLEAGVSVNRVVGAPTAGDALLVIV
jgi:hypothetical protein